MVRGGENKSGRYPEVLVFAKGGRKGAIWFLEGRKGGGWARVASELRKMTSFLDSKDQLMGLESIHFELAGCVFQSAGWVSFLCGCSSGGRYFSRQACREATFG
jgi:hypothetical protein